MLKRVLPVAGAIGLAALLLAAPAQAQKAKDTLRLGFQDPISTADEYQDPKPETIITAQAVFDTLMVYDPSSRTVKPGLAESWTRIDPTTVEFKLRHGVKWHDGSDFTADDVVNTVNWLIDPNTKLRFAGYNAWILQMQKIDDYTVRLIEKQPTSYDMVLFGTNIAILPAKIFNKFAQKSDFGRQTPVGTGPYKVVSIDPSKGIVLVRNPDFKAFGPWRPAGTIEKIEIVPIPDMQTEIAQIMTSGLDVLHDVPKDQAKQLEADPSLAATVAPGLNLYFMAIDSIGRSGNTALAKPEVRQALMMAIDRDSLVKNVVVGGSYAKVINATCVEVQGGCAVSNAPPSYDIAGAKALLAKAGYPDGFDVDVMSNPGAEEMSEAVAGELRKINVRAKVDHPTFVAYREKQTGGKMQILVGNWSAGGVPDVSGTIDYFFSPGPRDYYKDDTIWKLRNQATAELDPAKRTDFFRQIFDRVNEQHYIMPLTTLPTIFIHTKDVEIENTSTNGAALELTRIHWK